MNISQVPAGYGASWAAQDAGHGYYRDGELTVARRRTRNPKPASQIPVTDMIFKLPDVGRTVAAALVRVAASSRGGNSVKGRKRRRTGSSTAAGAGAGPEADAWTRRPGGSGSSEVNRIKLGFFPSAPP